MSIESYLRVELVRNTSPEPRFVPSIWPDVFRSRTCFRSRRRLNRTQICRAATPLNLDDGRTVRGIETEAVCDALGPAMSKHTRGYRTSARSTAVADAAPSAQRNGQRPHRTASSQKPSADPAGAPQARQPLASALQVRARYRCIPWRRPRGRRDCTESKLHSPRRSARRRKLPRRTGRFRCSGRRRFQWPRCLLGVLRRRWCLRKSRRTNRSRRPPGRWEPSGRRLPPDRILSAVEDIGRSGKVALIVTLVSDRSLAGAIFADPSDDERAARQAQELPEVIAKTRVARLQIRLLLPRCAIAPEHVHCAGLRSAVVSLIGVTPRAELPSGGAPTAKRSPDRASAVPNRRQPRRCSP